AESPLERAFEGLDAHVPGVDDIDRVGPVRGQRKRAKARAREAEVGQVVLAGDARPRQVPLGRERLEAFRALLEDLAEKADAGWAVALEHASLGPPQDVVVGQVGLAVTDVGAADRALPEAPDHLFGGDV